MRALRYAALVALAIWTGGLIVLGVIAAPAVFDVLPARQPGDGRVLAGAVFGEVLRRFHLLSYGCAAVFGLSLVTRAVLGPRPTRFLVRAIACAAMVAATLYSGTVIAPRIAAVQQRAGASVSSLPEGDPRRVEFARLHGMSRTIELVPLLGGLVLMFFELRD
jgi:uncharacterized protein DUF4149